MARDKTGKNTEISGSIGMEPPPDAPRETSQPLRPETIALHQSHAAANERELPPLKAPTGPPLTPEQAAARLREMGMVIPITPDVSFFDETPAAHAKTIAPPGATPAPAAVTVDPHYVPPLTADEIARMPAASESDRPSKGLLADLYPPKGDKFTGVDRGGWGHSDSAQYFPLDGNELRELILGFFDQMAERIRNDLRFSLALTYPRVSARVVIEIDAIAEDLASLDQQIEIVKTLDPKEGEPGSTPMEVARKRGDRVVFALVEARNEFDAAGESETPPDAVRDELGLTKPRMQLIQDASGQSFVDVPSGDVRALTR